MVDRLAGDPHPPRRKRCMPAAPTPRLATDQRGPHDGFRTPDHAQAIAGIHAEAPRGGAQAAGLLDFSEEKGQPVFRVPKTSWFRG